MKLIKCASYLYIGLALSVNFAQASGGGDWDKAPVDYKDKASLQRGLELFVNYCQACHSLQYMRYNRVGQDLELSDELLLKSIIFDGSKVGETMQTALKSTDAKNWFGVAPPDLSLVARVRGVDWIYTYLRSFYLDEKSAIGVNNRLIPNVAMPNILESFQGMQVAKYAKQREANGAKKLIGLELIEQGSITAVEFDGMIADLVNFLDYVGDPAKMERRQLGGWVLLFLAFLLIFTVLLKREYWKDVH